MFSRSISAIWGQKKNGPVTPAAQNAHQTERIYLLSPISYYFRGGIEIGLSLR